MSVIIQIIKSFIQRVLKYRFNTLFYLLLVGVLYFSFWQFFEVVERPLSLDYPPAIIFNVASAFLLSLLYFIPLEKKGFTFVPLVALSAYLLSNSLYYRTYYTIMPIDSFTMVENLNGLRDSIFSSFRQVDAWFVLPTASLMLLYYAFLRKRIVAEPKTSRMGKSGLIFVIIAIVIGNQLYEKRNDVSNLLSKENEFRYDAIEGTSTYGFVCCWIWQMSEYFNASKDISPQEQLKVENWLTAHAEDETHFERKISLNGNVILLVVESMESFPIGKSIAGEVITPNLNAFLKSDSCFYASHVVPQVKEGRSSDAQLMINSGLLPLNSGAACFRNPRNDYHTLAKAMKTKGYSTTTLLGGNASFWNQGVFNKVLGYDRLISIDQFRYDETYEFGLTDSSFMAQSIEHLVQLPKPFFAQMITLSSHAPFELIDHRVYLHIPKDCPRYLANYLNAIHYVDQCIGRFVADLRKVGLYDQTTIIITGDHDAFNHKPYLANKYGKQLFIQQSYDPLIILHSPIKKIYSAEMGQIDIYPTLLDILGANGYDWHGLGFSILGSKQRGFAIDAKKNIVCSSPQCSDYDFHQATEAWTISDIIISKNFFTQSHLMNRLAKDKKYLIER